MDMKPAAALVSAQARYEVQSWSSLSAADGRRSLRCSVECRFRDNEMSATDHASDWPISALEAALGNDGTIKG